MKTAVYSIHRFEKEYLLQSNAGKHELQLIESSLNEQTVVLADGCSAISVFVNDEVSSKVLQRLQALGVHYIVLRSAGYNHVNLTELHRLGMKAARVPEYSPYSVAEHSVALMLALNRKLIKANQRVDDLNFSLDGLEGFDMHGKTVGLIGTGKIGSVATKILYGFGCNILAFDKTENVALCEQFGVRYTDCDTLCKESDIITLHIPLVSETKYIINKDCIDSMKSGVMLINTSRGGLVNTVDVIEGLKSGKIKYFGMDVYEEEEHLFFEDHSEDIPQDEVLARLMSFKNVLITGHQAFFTKEALQGIADTTIYNLDCFEKGIKSNHEL